MDFDDLKENLQAIIATLGKWLGLPTSQADPRWTGQGHLKRNLRAGERTPSGMHTGLATCYDANTTMLIFAEDET